MLNRTITAPEATSSRERSVASIRRLAIAVIRFLDCEAIIRALLASDSAGPIWWMR